MNSPADIPRWTTTRIQAQKGKQKIACLTAYDYGTARLVDEAGIQLIIVGDSLGMTVLGYDSTLPVTMDDMLHHTRAVARGAPHALVVADMPFLSYQASLEQAIDNAGRLLKDGRAGAVKIEGGAFRRPTVEALVQNGIPVMGHIGLTPQSVKAFGGYKVQGRTPEQAARLLEDAHALSEAGCFAIVLEGIPAALSPSITSAVPVPTIGIGAGPGCDGQVLVIQDMLGMFSDVSPRFVKRYASLGETMNQAFRHYVQEVRDGEYPGPEHCY
jgi:3-methyl-2-oxobutanoate hydroxymethyltransferase